MRKSSRKSAKVFHEKDATLIAEKVCVLKQFVGGWWEEMVDLTPCNGATPSESRIREIRTCGSMRGTEVERPPPTLLDGAFLRLLFYIKKQGHAP
jgi:hypothetical protein